MPILPLPQFEADVKALEEDRREHAAMRPPETIVVRYGAMKMIGEFPYEGSVRPGCGTKVVVRTHRGVELGEMLTSTCPNAGCAKSVTRQEMLRYIENSGGREYPFSTRGKVLRVATREDLRKAEEIEQSRHGLRLQARRVVEELGIAIKIVDVEPILGGQVTTYFYTSEHRADQGDIRRLADRLRTDARTRVEIRHVGARDEARLTADYERCGQYCCCKNFLKVLKPVSMRSAKTQKQTLDPLKISGRCGRLMCCLRYEDQTYEELRRRLPRRNARVSTPEGDGVVVDTQILTQLVLVRLDGADKPIAVPVEEIGPPGQRPAAPPAQAEDAPAEGQPKKRRRRRRKKKAEGADQPPQVAAQAEPEVQGEAKKKRRRRRSRRRRRGGAGPGGEAGGDGGGAGAGGGGGP